jgi:S-sulfo-L-cysteine synthase (O-acetyl-L-serine-dependent)
MDSSTLLDRVGNTPLVKLQNITAHLPPSVEVWVKCEWFNPGGSVKDRAARAIVRRAVAEGALDGRRLLDASSGNTGIAYAWMGARLGFGVTLCLPKNANAERRRTLEAYGVELVLTSPLEGSDGAILKARELAATGDYLYVDQYSNEANWQAHFEGTGPEIWRDTEGGVTHFVSTLGTSGTFMGTSRFLQQHGVHCTSVQPDSPFHGLEGLKHMESAIVPAIYDASVADSEIGAPTEESLEMVRRLAREEGLLAGVSSGAAVWAALQLAGELAESLSPAWW